MRTTGTRSSRPPRPRPGLLLSLVAIVIALLPATAAAGPGPAAKAPRLDASSWLLVDRKDGAELAARVARKPLAIASTTKLMTAYLALEKLKMKQKLTVPRYEAAAAESVAGLIEGERLTVHDLLVAMLLPSANDAAITVAEGVSGSEKAFVRAMNRTATRLGLSGTHYANPIGLDAKGNYSTAHDLSTLAEELLADKRFRRIVAMPKATLKSGDRRRAVTNTNTLLFSDPSVDGVKTGHTNDAGYVLVASAKRKGVPLLAAVLGAPSESDRDAETEQLLDYGYSLYERQAAVRRDDEQASVAVRYEDEPLSVVARRGVAVRVRDDEKVRVDVEAPAEVEGPIAAGERLGTATVTVDGRFSDRTPLVAARAVAAPTIIDRIGGPPVAGLILLALIVILATVVIAMRRRSNGGGNGNRDSEERMRTRQERIRRRRRGRTNDPHGDAEHRAGPDGRRAADRARQPSPGRRLASRGGRQGRQHRPGPEGARRAGDRDRVRGRSDRRPDPRAARRRAGPPRLRRGCRRLADQPRDRRSDVGRADRDQRARTERHARPTSSASPSGSSTWPAVPSSA